MAGHCCDIVGILVDEEVVVAVVGEIVNEFDEHVLWRRARLRLLFVVVVVFCQLVVPNGRFGTVFVCDGAHVGFIWMERVRWTGAVPEWGWAPWVGPLGVGGHCCLFLG